MGTASSGKAMAKLIPSSFQTSAERQLDVVFMHSLSGNPIETGRSVADEKTS
jgi:hypothetical protein